MGGEIKVEDSVIIFGILSENPEALRELMETYGDRLMKSARIITKDDELAQDVLQETFIKAYYKMALYKGESKLYTWLYSIMLNQCRKKLRSAWLKKVILRERQDISVNNTYENINVERIDVNHALYSLPEKYRKLALMFYYEDFTIKQICEATGQKEGTVKSSLNRLRTMLKQYLEEGIRDETSK